MHHVTRALQVTPTFVSDWFDIEVAWSSSYSLVLLVIYSLSGIIMDGRRRYIRDDQNGLPRSPGLPRGVRPQRSMVDVSTRSKPSRRDWNDAPSLPQSSSHSRGYNSEIRPPITPPNRVSKVSLESASSHGSSTFSREQAYESSTSVDEPPLSKSAHREWASSRNRQRSSGFTAELSPHDGNVIDPRQSSAPHRIAYTTGDIGADDTTMIDGYGASLWNRIATAANSLTINVSKAWAAGLFTEDGQGRFPVSYFRYLTIVIDALSL